MNALRKVGRFFKEPGLACVAAVQFLTIAAPLVRRSFSEKELGRSVGWFPLVGLALGGVLVAVNLLLGLVWHGNVLQTALLLTLWVLLTGALHVDGFLDSCDGLLGGRSEEQRLEIMRDPRVGSFAVIGGVLLLLLKFTALTTVRDRTVGLLLAPTLGRWCISWALICFPYARAEGLGRAMKDHAGWRELFLATFCAGATALVLTFFAGPWVLAVTAAAFLAAWLVAKWVMTRIPGFTGDVFGAMCETTELLVLVLMAVPLAGIV